MGSEYGNTRATLEIFVVMKTFCVLTVSTAMVVLNYSFVRCYHSVTWGEKGARDLCTFLQLHANLQ